MFIVLGCLVLILLRFSQLSYACFIFCLILSFSLFSSFYICVCFCLCCCHSNMSVGVTTSIINFLFSDYFLLFHCELFHQTPTVYCFYCSITYPSSSSSCYYCYYCYYYYYYHSPNQVCFPSILLNLLTDFCTVNRCCFCHYFYYYCKLLLSP